MRFGLIGAGTVGQIRKAAVDAMPDCTLSAVFDANTAAARQVASGVRVFESAESMFAGSTAVG